MMARLIVPATDMWRSASKPRAEARVIFRRRSECQAGRRASGRSLVNVCVTRVPCAGTIHNLDVLTHTTTTIPFVVKVFLRRFGNSRAGLGLVSVRI
jgi:hypothetical protein